jgi:hypothetical protein
MAAFVFSTPGYAEVASVVQLPVRYLFNGKPLEFHKRTMLSDTTSISLTRLEYLVSDVHLAPVNDATSVTAQYYHLNPLEQEATLSVNVPTSVPVQALRFSVGVLPEINHCDPARFAAGHPLNVLECNLHWGWQTGYVFFAAEGSAIGAIATQKTFLYHLGTDPNLMHVEVKMPSGLALTDAELLFHVDRIWNGVTSVSPMAGGGVTHSTAGDQLAPALCRNIESAFEIRKREN